MKEELEAIRADALAEVSGLSDEAGLEDFRIRYLGRKGRLTGAAAGMRDVAKEDKAAVGQLLNETRQAITAAVDEMAARFVAAQDAKAAEGIDVTLPGRIAETGNSHPISQVLDRAVSILRRMGFALAGPGDRDGVALFRCAEHAARSPGAE